MRDIEYLKSLYPLEIKRMLSYVSEACDRLDYKNSPMYDEYPDRVSLRRLCSQVYEKEFTEGTGEEEARWLEAAVEVLLYHEICRRRARRRDMRRKYGL